MTPNIDLKPSATATAAPASRQRSTADAADDPFAACLQTATQQNRQNDSSDTSRQNDSQKTQSSQEAQSSPEKASSAKPSWTSRRKPASEKKTTKDQDNSDSSPADTADTAEPAATVDADPAATAATVAASDADTKHDAKDNAKIDAVAQWVIEPETFAAAVAAVAVAAAQPLQPAPQTNNTPKPANPVDAIPVDRGSSAKIERAPQNLPADPQADSPTPTRNRPAPAPPPAKSDASVPASATVQATPANTPPTDTTTATVTATATDRNEPAAVLQPRERPAREAKESAPAAPVSPHAVSGIKANNSQTPSDTSDNPPSGHRPSPSPGVPHFQHPGRFGPTAETDNSPSNSAGVLSTQTVDPRALAMAPDISAELQAVTSDAPASASAPQGMATNLLAGVNLPVPGTSLHSAKSANAAQDSPAPVSDQTYDQVVLGLRTKMDATNQRAEIELNPPNLGKLQVSIAVSNGQLTAQFRTSSDVVRDLLSSKIDHLRSVLEGQGITVDKLTVNTTPAPSTGSDFRPTTSTGTDQHDGRSGGAFSQERQTPRQHANEGFSQMWRAALAKEQPIDLLA